ncbi:MAG: hypothetical protein NUW01_16390 [Gemmatimonadaceae bacterium]|nr:hypothetical protein [Gemmatimonadaceae bacterium]
MRALDTSVEAAAMQHRLHQALGTEARVALAKSASELAREFAKAGLRDRHPEYTEEELLRELANKTARTLDRP